MFVVKLGADASMLVLDIAFKAFTCKNFFGYLELKGLKNALIFKEAGELDTCDQLFHVYQRQTYKLEHLFEE